MMLILVLILALVLAFIGWRISDDVFAPYVVTPVVWSIIISIYYFLPGGFYPICHEFPYAIMIWLIVFFITSISAEYMTTPSSVESALRRPNMTVIYGYIALSAIVIPILSTVIIHQAMTEDPSNVFRYMRVLNTGSDENIEAPDFGVFVYTYSVVYVVLFFTYLYIENKWVIFLVLLINILLAGVTMSKTNFLQVLFSSMYVSYIRGKISLKHIAWGMVFFLLFSLGLQTIRTADEFSTDSFLSLYLSSSMVAFDYFAIPLSSSPFGAHTFRLFYAIGHAIGLTGAPEDTILNFVSVPSVTNTYTILYPFYEDFGMAGIWIFAAIYGLLYGYIYKKQRTGGKVQLILYAIMLTFLLMQFIGEFIFTNASQFIQFVVLAILPFVLQSKSGSNMQQPIRNS